jgi:predicted MFS family arabinose efflux permease
VTAGALRSRDYRRFWAGSFVANLGMWIQQVALGWLVYDLTRRASWLGTVSLAGNLPTLLLGLLGGAIADRASRRVVMTTSALLLAAGALLLAILTASGQLALWHILTVAVASGAAAALYTPAMHSVMPSLVEREDLLSAISLNSVQFNLARAIGPALAGSLYGVVGAAGCFGLNAVGFVALALVLQTIALPGKPAAPATPIGRALREGLGYAFGHPTIASLLVLATILSLFAFPYIILLPALAREDFGLDATGLGWLVASMGGGAVVGGLVASTIGNVMRGAVVAPAGSIVLGAVLATFGLVDGQPAAMALLALTGLTQTVTVASLTTRVQIDVDEDMRGRVMSMLTVVYFGLTTVGGLLGGLLADRVGVTPTLAAGGLTTATAALALSWRLRRARRATAGTATTAQRGAP